MADTPKKKKKKRSLLSIVRDLVPGQAGKSLISGVTKKIDESTK